MLNAGSTPPQGQQLPQQQQPIQQPMVGILNPTVGQNPKEPVLKQAFYGIAVNKPQQEIEQKVLKSPTNPNGIDYKDLHQAVNFVHDIKNGSGVDELANVYTGYSPGLVADAYDNLNKIFNPQAPMANIGGIEGIGEGGVANVNKIAGRVIGYGGAGLAAAGVGALIKKGIDVKKGAAVKAAMPATPEELQQMASRMTGLGEVSQLENNHLGSSIIAEHAQQGTSTFKELNAQIPTIKDTYYNKPVDLNGKQVPFKDALKSIPVEDPTRSLELIDSMRKDIVLPGGKPKLGNEELYQDLTALKNKFRAGQATLLDQTELKTAINKFNKVWTEAGSQKSGVNPEGLKNVYNEIKGQIQSTAENAGLKDVASHNKGYQALMDASDLIEKQANTALKATNKATNPSTIEKIAGYVGKALHLKSNPVGAVVGGLSNKSTSASIAAIEKELPTILEKLKNAGGTAAKALKTNPLDVISSAMKSIDPVFTPQLLEMIPGTIGEAFKKYNQESPVGTALKGLSETNFFPSEEEKSKIKEEQKKPFMFKA